MTSMLSELMKLSITHAAMLGISEGAAKYRET